jgi:biopolymer transport protein ExbD
MKHSDIAHYRQLNMLRRRFRTRIRRFPPVLEPAAMMDVVLLVLLFFMISSSYVSRPGLEVVLPEVRHSTGFPMDALVVTVTRNGQVFFQDRRIPDGELGNAILRAYQERPGAALIIEADGEVSVDVQMGIYRQAVAAGVNQVALATRGPRQEMR